MSDQTTALPPDEYLTAEQVLELRGILRRDAEALMEKGRIAVSQFTTTENRDADHIDVATSESSREFTLRLADRERRMLGKIRTALNRPTASTGSGSPSSAT